MSGDFQSSVDTPIAFEQEAERVRSYVEASKSKNTVRAYQADAREFDAWCAARDQPSLPASPATVAAFLAGCADRGLKASTIGRKASAIRYAHKARGFDSPTAAAEVEATLAGIRREIGMASTQKAPATATAIAVMLSHINTTSMSASATGHFSPSGSQEPSVEPNWQASGRGYRLHRKLGTRR